jgi:hemerythrin superfamily protein
MDALTLLKSDHRKVERLFARYPSANGNKGDIVREITRELTAHMDAEERELYPLLRTSIEDGESLMDDAVKEHAEARSLLADLGRGEEGSFDMDAKVATLRRAIEHHVSDEENKIFPKARQAFGKTRLMEIGSRLARAEQAAPAAPPASAARRSPGSSVVGMIAAATSRVTSLLVPPVGETARPARRRSARKRTRTGAKRSLSQKAGRKSAAKGTQKAARKTAVRTARKTARKAPPASARKTARKNGRKTGRPKARAGATKMRARNASRKRVAARKSK